MGKVKEPSEDVYKIYDFQYPVLKIPVDHAPGLIIGRRKAKAILQHLDAIRAFVAKHEVVECPDLTKMDEPFTEDFS
jgi:hypothetical protein